MKKRIFSSLFLLASAGFSAGCAEQFVAKKAESSDRLQYMVRAIPQTLLDRSGNACASADGVVWVSTTKVGGEVKDAYGRRYALSGKRDTNGQVSAGLAYSHQNVANWSGNISDEQGSGSWQDQFGCEGNWQATRL